MSVRASMCTPRRALRTSKCAEPHEGKERLLDCARPSARPGVLGEEGVHYAGVQVRGIACQHPNTLLYVAGAPSHEQRESDADPWVKMDPGFSVRHFIAPMKRMANECAVPAENLVRPRAGASPTLSYPYPTPEAPRPQTQRRAPRLIRAAPTQDGHARAARGAPWSLSVHRAVAAPERVERGRARVRRFGRPCTGWTRTRCRWSTASTSTPRTSCTTTV